MRRRTRTCWFRTTSPSGVWWDQSSWFSDSDVIPSLVQKVRIVRLRRKVCRKWIVLFIFIVASLFSLLSFILSSLTPYYRSTCRIKLDLKKVSSELFITPKGSVFMRRMRYKQREVAMVLLALVFLFHTLPTSRMLWTIAGRKIYVLHEASSAIRTALNLLGFNDDRGAKHWAVQFEM